MSEKNSGRKFFPLPPPPDEADRSALTPSGAMLRGDRLAHAFKSDIEIALEELAALDACAKASSQELPSPERPTVQVDAPPIAHATMPVTGLMALAAQFEAFDADVRARAQEDLSGRLAHIREILQKLSTLLNTLAGIHEDRIRGEASEAEFLRLLLRRCMKERDALLGGKPRKN